MEQSKGVLMKKAWDYMQELAQNKEVTESNQFYMPVPQKVLRCINLRGAAKIIFFDIVSYMGYNHYSYPSIEDIALNCGMSHATVQANMKELEEKKFLFVRRRRNNTYYLPDGLHLNPYILLSEALHGFSKVISRTGMLSDRKRNEWIKSVIDGEIYATKLIELSNEYDSYLDMEQPYIELGGLKKLKESLKGFTEAVTSEFSSQYPEIVL